MHVEVCRDAERAGVTAAAIIAEGQPRVLGVATGSSPLPTYRALAARTDLSIETLVLLDEYIGLDPDHPERYRTVVLRDVAVPLGVPAHCVLSPDVDAADLHDAAARYDELVRTSHVDVQILGLGRNGHIAFNEPGTPATSTTRVVELTEATRRDNARFFEHPDDVPHRAITQGIATILAARRIVLIATGAAKADAIARLLHGPVDTAVPATALLAHSDVVVVVDEEAHHLIGAR